MSSPEKKADHFGMTWKLMMLLWISIINETNVKTAENTFVDVSSNFLNL